MKNGGFTISSLIYWARADSPEEFKKYMVQTYDFYIKRSLDTNTYYIAKALHNKFSEKFVCVSLSKNIWYEFKNHKWVLSEGGTGLINLICNEFINDFHQLVINYNQKALQVHGSEKEDFQNKASKTQKIIDRLLNITFKKQIMEEAKNLFYDNEFLKKLDEINKNLIAFENGVYDLEKEEFRVGRNLILASSDVSARGMDYPDVTFVLQVGMTERDQYIHRLGRTARAGKSGTGLLLLAPL
jgi:hypothetical protein